MKNELSEQLTRAAGALPALDDAIFQRVSRPRKRPGRVITVTSVAVLLMVAATWALLPTDDSVVRLVQDPAGRVDGSAGAGVGGAPPVPHTVLTSDDDWEVMAVGVTPVSGPSRMAADQAELHEAWASFEMDGPPPVLPSGQGALVLSVAGDCDDASQVLGIERLPAVNATGDFAALHVDPECAIIDRFGYSRNGPRALYVIGVPVDTVNRVVGFEAVTAPVADLQWRFLAAAPEPGAGSFGVLGDQGTLDWAWQTWELGGPVPRLPAGWDALLVPVPGTCTDASQIHGIEAVGYLYEHGFDTVMPAAQFDPACAQIETDRRGVQPRTVYAAVIPSDVAATLHGPEAYIACGEADDVGACADIDIELIHTRRSAGSDAVGATRPVDTEAPTAEADAAR